MELILGVSAAILAVLCITLFVRSMELTSSHNELRDLVNTAQREAKKLKDQLTNQNAKFQAKSQEASRSGKSTRDQKQRLSQLTDELQVAKSDLEKNRTRVRELSVETDSLRIQREELRTKLSSQQSHQEKAPVPAPAREVAVVKEVLEAPIAAPIAASLSEEQLNHTMATNERELQRAVEFIEQLQDRHHRLRQRLVVATADLRLVSRKNENNRRAYMITQLQLDLAQDELYTIEHGHPPEMPRAEKSKKRASLTPVEETVEVNREAALIELPDVDALEAETERRLAEERAERQAAALAEAEAEAQAEAAALAEAEAEAIAEAQALAEAIAAAEAEVQAQETAEAEAGQKATEDGESKQTGTVRRRRATAP